MDGLPAPRAGDGGRSVRPLLDLLEWMLALDTTTLPDALARASGPLAAVLGADAVEAYLHDPARDALVPVGAAAASDRRRRARPSGAARDWMGEVYRTGTVRVVRRQGRAARSLLAVPLEIDGQLRGVVQAAAARPDAWSDDDVRVLTAVAHLLGRLLRWTARADDARRASEGRLAAIVASAPLVLFAFDRAGAITLSVGRGLAGLGRARSADTLGRSVFDVYRDIPEIGAYARRALAGETCGGVVTVGAVTFDVSYTPIRAGVGGVSAVSAVSEVVGVATDITERARAERALRHQALHDVLTGLPNRLLLHDRLAQALRVARRAERRLALLLLDLDRFKEVNDTFGHHVGDGLLRQAPLRLQRLLRASDTVARLGGDEFAVLLLDDGAEAAIAVAGKLRAALDAPFVVEEHTLAVGVSIGVAFAPAHGDDGLTLLRHADVAMYTAKRDQVGIAVYDPARDAHSPERLALGADLRRAIDAGQLRLHYQPKVDLARGRLRSVEALVRWPHPTQGLIPPDQFIPLAEQTGLITRLTRRVLRTALAQRRAWARAGVPLVVDVNLSMADLHDADLPAVIATLLRTYGVPHGALHVEITESMVMVDTGRALETLARLAGLGVRAAIDDFGTGYSSLASLKRLPVDELKIDRGFVRDLAHDATDAAIVAAAIGLGHGLGLRVVAEGVEDRDAWDRLAALGCDTVQGYYVSPPLPAAAFLRWLRAGPYAAASAGGG